jgi:hypothetical protein
MNRSAALISSLFLALATPAWSCTIFVVARNGMVIAGEDWSGYSISSAGDVNGDDLDDLLIGAALAGPTGSSRAGETYLVYGRSGGATLSGAFDLADADVTFNGIDVDGLSGSSFCSLAYGYRPRNSAA